MTVVRCNDGSNDWIEREPESGHVIKIPDYGQIALHGSKSERGCARVVRSVKGWKRLSQTASVHPKRLWGAFPRVLGYYCRERGLFWLEEAVRWITGLPAARFGLTARGPFAASASADTTVFDPQTVIDHATFEAPTMPASGIEHVFANSRPVWSEGKPTGEHPGRALRCQKVQPEAR
jgi:N-acyl-D-amino-acid deacylase